MNRALVSEYVKIDSKFAESVRYDPLEPAKLSIVVAA